MVNPHGLGCSEDRTNIMDRADIIQHDLKTCPSCGKWSGLVLIDLGNGDAQPAGTSRAELALVLTKIQWEAKTAVWVATFDETKTGCHNRNCISIMRLNC